MNETDPRRDELFAIIERLLDGRMSDADHETLESMIADPSLCREYIDYLTMQQHLRMMFGGNLGQGAYVSDFATTATALASPSNRSAFGSPAAWIAYATIAATLIFVGFWLRNEEGDPNQRVVASSPQTKRSGVVVAQATKVRFFDRAPMLVGSTVPRHNEFELLDGMIELSFPSGASTIIESPAVFVVLADDMLRMNEGQCSVHAPPGAEGFRVTTPYMNVVDLGTRFRVGVSRDGIADVRVVEGAAEIYELKEKGSNQQQSPILLQANEGHRHVQKRTKPDGDKNIGDSDSLAEFPDRIVSFDVNPDSELTSITVQRGGNHLEYSMDQMIGFEVVHFVGGYVDSLVTSKTDFKADTSNPLRDRLADYLDKDHSLCTGLLNVGGDAESLLTDPVLESSADEGTKPSPGLGIRFKSPVVNSAGPDVVFFEIQGTTQRTEGDFFRVSPLEFQGGRRTHFVGSYDIDTISPESLFLPGIRVYGFRPQVDSLASLNPTNIDSNVEKFVRFKTICVGIDLSDLGFEQGESVSGLFVQDVLDDLDMVDPVFIGGLPLLFEK